MSLPPSDPSTGSSLTFKLYKMPLTEYRSEPGSLSRRDGVLRFRCSAFTDGSTKTDAEFSADSYDFPDKGSNDLTARLQPTRMVLGLPDEKGILFEYHRATCWLNDDQKASVKSSDDFGPVEIDQIQWTYDVLGVTDESVLHLGADFSGATKTLHAT